MTDQGEPLQICPNCGQENALQSLKCIRCGELLEGLFHIDDYDEQEGVDASGELDNQDTISTVLNSLDENALLNEQNQADSGLSEPAEETQPEPPAWDREQVPDWLERVRQRVKEEESALSQASGGSGAGGRQSEDERAQVDQAFAGMLRRIREQAENERKKNRPSTENLVDENGDPEWLRRIRELHPPTVEESQNLPAKPAVSDELDDDWTEEELQDLLRREIGAQYLEEHRQELNFPLREQPPTEETTLEPAAEPGVPEDFHNIPDDDLEEREKPISLPDNPLESEQVLSDSAGSELPDPELAVDPQPDFETELSEAPADEPDEEPDVDADTGAVDEMEKELPEGLELQEADGETPAIPPILPEGTNETQFAGNSEEAPEPDEDGEKVEPDVDGELVEPDANPEAETAEDKNVPEKSADLILRRDQRQRAQTLKNIIEQEGRRSIAVLHEKTPQGKLGRLILALLLMIGVVTALVLGPAQKLELGVSPMSSAFEKSIGQIKSGERILVVLEYQAATSAELESLAKPVFTKLLAQGAEIRLLTSQPADVWLAGGLFDSDFPEEVPKTEFVPGGILGYLALSAGFTPAWGKTPIEKAISGGADLFDQSGAVLIITDSFDFARVWLEQVAPWKLGLKTLVITTAVNAPVLQPYFASRQLSGYLAGAADHSGQALNQRAWQVGVMIMMVVILLGMISKADADANQREEQRNARE